MPAITFSVNPAPLHGFAFWFDVEFGGPADLPTSNGDLSSDNNNCKNGGQRKRRTNPSEGLVLSTAPEDPPTHWQQVLSSYLFIFLQLKNLVPLLCKGHIPFFLLILKYICLDGCRR